MQNIHYRCYSCKELIWFAKVSMDPPPFPELRGSVALTRAAWEERPMLDSEGLSEATGPQPG